MHSIVSTLTWLVPSLLLALPAQAMDPPPDPSLPGPFGVGHESVSMIDASREDRTLPVEIWYPVDPADHVGDRTFYSLLGLLGFTSSLSIDGAPPTANDDLPVIVFSHGSGGTRIQSTEFCERLASHGFLVVAPDHVGNTTMGASDPFPVILQNRPQDVSFVYDELLARSADALDPLFGKVSTRAGIAGHSLGGWTSFATVLGTGAVAADSRFQAIMPMAPFSTIITQSQFATLDVPMLLVSGTLDSTTPILPHTVLPWLSTLLGPDKVRVDIEGAEHEHFAGVCDIGNALIEGNFLIESWPLIGAGALVPIYERVCTPTAFPVNEAIRIAAKYGVSFFRFHLEGDRPYRDVYLNASEAAANEPDLALFEIGRFYCGNMGPELALVPVILFTARRRLHSRVAAR